MKKRLEGGLKFYRILGKLPPSPVPFPEIEVLGKTPDKLRTKEGPLAPRTSFRLHFYRISDGRDPS